MTEESDGRRPMNDQPEDREPVVPMTGNPSPESRDELPTQPPSGPPRFGGAVRGRADTPRRRRPADAADTPSGWQPPPTWGSAPQGWPPPPAPPSPPHPPLLPHRRRPRWVPASPRGPRRAAPVRRSAPDRPVLRPLGRAGYAQTSTPPYGQNGPSYGPNIPGTDEHPAYGQAPSTPYGQGPGTPYAQDPASGGGNYGYPPASWGPPPSSSQPSKRRAAVLAAVAVIVLVLASAGVGAAVSAAMHSNSNNTAAPRFGNEQRLQLQRSANGTGLGHRKRGQLGNGTGTGSGTVGHRQRPGTRAGHRRQPPAAIVAKVNPAVVDIYTTINTGSGEGEAAGTGMIITSSGEVLTNNHVIDGATTFAS